MKVAAHLVLSSGKIVERIWHHQFGSGQSDGGGE